MSKNIDFGDVIVIIAILWFIQDSFSCKISTDGDKKKITVESKEEKKKAVSDEFSGDNDFSDHGDF